MFWKSQRIEYLGYTKGSQPVLRVPLRGTSNLSGGMRQAILLSYLYNGYLLKNGY